MQMVLDFWVPSKRVPSPVWNGTFTITALEKINILLGFSFILKSFTI